MIDDVEQYFARGCGRCARFDTPDCSVRQWQAGLSELRRICLASGLAETLKWAHPCYMREGRNIAIIGAFRTDFRLSFFNAALMQDPAGVLERSGPNTRHPGTIRFSDPARVARMEAVIVAYLREAIGYADAGISPPKERHEFDLPEELVTAMEDDPVLAAAFQRLTPGRRRSYVIALSAAKKPETRRARIDRFRDKILAGKGATER